MNNYVVIDLETTGLQPKTDRILEIGAIKICDNKVTDTYGTLVNPRMAIPYRITEITGITQEMAKTGAENIHAVRQLVQFCEGFPLLGHNIMFDYSFVKHSAVNLGLDFEKEGVDTLQIARKVLPDLEGKSLQQLRNYYGISQNQAHRAVEDATTTYLLYERLKQEFQDKQPSVFCVKPLIYKVKKQSPVTNAQKRYLQDLLKYHRIELDAEIESLSKSEASRRIDRILSTHGRIMR